MIKSSDLENRAELTPDPLPPRGTADVQAAIGRMKNRTEPKEDPPPARDAAAERLAALQARIRAARDLRPPRGIEDGRCWGMGRDAALAALDGE